MFFFNGRIRNPHIIPIVVGQQAYSTTVSNSFIIAGCLSIIIGLALIITGGISETKKTTFIGIGIISLGVGFFITTMVCFYSKLDICYHNWAYGQNVVPLNTETPPPVTASNISMAPFAESVSVTQKIQSTMPMSATVPMTMTSDLEINNVFIARSIKIDNTKINQDNIT